MASTNRDRSLQADVPRVVVIVIAARSRRREIAGVAALPGRKRRDRVDWWTIRVRRVRVRLHVVRPRVVVHERDNLADINSYRLRTHATRRDRHDGPDWPVALRRRHRRATTTTRRQTQRGDDDR